jgi:hypothetical protein
MHINDRIEKVKALVSDIADDAQKILAMVQMSIPVAEGLVQRVLDRAEQAKRIFTVEESHGRRA